MKTRAVWDRKSRQEPRSGGEFKYGALAQSRRKQENIIIHRSHPVGRHVERSRSNLTSNFQISDLFLIPSVCPHKATPAIFGQGHVKIRLT